jgi:Rrf2 family protein
MKLNNTSQYAIRILSYITLQEENSRISAAHLSQELQIPYKFLTKIMTELVKANFIESVRGREGGFRLKKPANTIKVDDILNLFNDSIKDEECLLGIGFCNNVCKCALHDQWMEPKLLLQKMFRESSLQDIAGKGTKI